MVTTVFCQIHPVAHMPSWNHFASSMNHHKTTTAPSNTNLNSQSRHHIENAIFDSRLSNLHGLMSHTCLCIAGKCSLFTKRRLDFFKMYLCYAWKVLVFQICYQQWFWKHLHIRMKCWNVYIYIYVCVPVHWTYMKKPLMYKTHKRNMIYW